MSKIIRRLRDAPNEAMKPIVQELEDLASVAEGRFTAGIKVNTFSIKIRILKYYDKSSSTSFYDHGTTIHNQ